MSRQLLRYGKDGTFNGSLSSFEVARKIKLESTAEKLLLTASKKLNLSARSYFKTIKNLINASKNELKNVEGIGEKTATNIIDVTNREFKE